MMLQIIFSLKSLWLACMPFPSEWLKYVDIMNRSSTFLHNSDVFEISLYELFYHCKFEVGIFVLWITAPKISQVTWLLAMLSKEC